MLFWVVIWSLILPGPVSSATVGDGQEAAALVKAFALADVKKQTHTAAEWKGKKAVVLIFLGTECPVSNGYAPEYARLAKAFGKRGVAFYGLHPDPDVTEEAALKHAMEYKLTFPILLDPTQKVTKRAGVTVTPEVVVLTPAGRVLYRGRVDDRYALDGKRREYPKTKDLEETLTAVLKGKAPAVARTKAFGCPLPDPKKE
jgi:peroxiredoxin